MQPDRELHPPETVPEGRDVCKISEIKPSGEAGATMADSARQSEGPQCRCGHARRAHEHYRPGTGCSLCEDCGSFRPGRAEPLGRVADSPEQLLERAREHAGHPAVTDAARNLQTELRTLDTLTGAPGEWATLYRDLTCEDDALTLALQDTGEAAALLCEALSDADAWKRAV